MTERFNINNYQPLQGIPVSVTTNWNSYTAILILEENNSVFKVINSDKNIQLSVVHHWSFL